MGDSVNTLIEGNTFPVDMIHTSSGSCINSASDVTFGDICTNAAIDPFDQSDYHTNKEAAVATEAFSDPQTHAPSVSPSAYTFTATPTTQPSASAFAASPTTIIISDIECGDGGGRVANCMQGGCGSGGIGDRGANEKDGDYDEFETMSPTPTDARGSGTSSRSLNGRGSRKGSALAGVGTGIIQIRALPNEFTMSGETSSAPEQQERDDLAMELLQSLYSQQDEHQRVVDQLQSLSLFWEKQQKWNQYANKNKQLKEMVRRVQMKHDTQNEQWRIQKPMIQHEHQKQQEQRRKEQLVEARAVRQQLDAHRHEWEGIMEDLESHQAAVHTNLSGRIVIRED
ncbi:unnamed protein product [Ectocarpus sp. CCAP 1310/34]|nr:unnamed protein product [Ectocarpus sp. CCAP 1310/34]